MRNRIQAYRYSSKVAGAANQGATTINPDGTFTNSNGTVIPTWIGLMLVNPIDLLTVEALVTHFRASGFSNAAQVTAVGVLYDQTTTFYPSDGVTSKMLPFSQAQSGGIIDFTKSLTGLIKPNSDNIVMIQFDRGTNFTIEMWKNDMLYTVIGVK